jgi:hypothetical protein
LKRRDLLFLPFVTALLPTGGWSCNLPRRAAAAAPHEAKDVVTLLSAPMELQGEWRGSPPEAAARVLRRMQFVCLSGVALLSDRQPERIRVDSHTSGSPAVWLHSDGARTAWIIVDVGARDWCKLAYQFGHELGHVLCNSWEADAKPSLPCQWLEEVLVEAFSLRGLALLAESWAHEPPFAGDAAFTDAILGYRADLLRRYGAYAAAQRAIPDMKGWFRTHRDSLEQSGGLSEVTEAAVPALLTELARDAGCVADLGALNRWPGRGGVKLEDYLRRWEASCGEIGTEGRLPGRVRGMLVDA